MSYITKGVGSMKANLTGIGLSVGLIVAAQANAKSQQVYDVNSLNNNQSSAQNQCSGLDCLLLMGTFSSEKYANRYKDHLSKKTKHPVKVERDKHDNNIFHVIVGPFNDFANMLKSGLEMTGKPVHTTTAATKKVTSASTRAVVNTGKTARKTTSDAGLLAFNNTMPAFFAGKKQSQNNTNKMKTKRTVARDGSKANAKGTPYQTRHQQLLASQADYPIHQKPQTDAKGNVVPLFETGPYLGLSAGVMTNVGKAPVTVGYQGFPGNISAGAAMMYTRRLYLGGEFYYGDTITAYNYTAGVNGYNIDNGWFYGGSFIPGYMITDTVLGYFRVGVMRNQFKSKPSTQASNFPIRSAYARRHTTVLNGWQIGLGSQTKLYKNIDGRVEYDFSYYRGVKGRSSSTNFRGNVNQVYLGLVYKFTDALHRA